jgi:hypothetical protein
MTEACSLTRRAIERSDSRSRLTFVMSVDAAEDGAAADLRSPQPPLDSSPRRRSRRWKPGPLNQYAVVHEQMTGSSAT